MPRRALVVINPAANHGKAVTLVPVAAELLEGCFPHDIVLTDGPAHAKSLAGEARRYDTVIAMGGDGTVHEVLNGLMEHAPESRPALAVLPTGSGNDYCNTLGISKDLAQAILQVSSGVRTHVDVGTCNGTYYANSLAIGIDAQMTAKAAELKATTGRTGLRLYLSALMHVLMHEYRDYEVRIRFDDDAPAVRAIELIAMTHGPTYGGGFAITPGAVPDDGLIDVCLIDAVPRWQALVRFPFVIPGKHAWMRPVHMSRHRHLRIESDVPIPAQIDGEVIVDDRFEVGILHAALDVVVPREDS